MPTLSPPATSPCIKVCVIEPASGWCLGCGRTIEEIMAWGSLNEGDRLTVMAGLPERMSALAAGQEAS
ncbi:DUF1289 domain-containing protein [Aureimonas sp. AU20]|uniref:DUF1289 domain-containing protein n=1 Tax=Aureimonas sp. AU20 TaxID=1349819 RepID=UPI000722383A|nr:DUF1289 domain-containing protein [Aureimonas sp. AU20]ALN73858.1 hypothetical protein M673_14115 [Aureimonas sp. AU20]